METFGFTLFGTGTGGGAIYLNAGAEVAVDVNEIALDLVTDETGVDLLTGSVDLAVDHAVIDIDMVQDETALDVDLQEFENGLCND